jgi:hypothetical protein
VNWLAKLIKADANRKSRFHDLAGTRLPLASLSSIPIASLDMLFRLGGRRRVQPWISYRAASEIERLLRPEWRVLEFGAGMSTLWFAKRVSFVLSIEANREWYERVCKQLTSRGFSNVEVRLRQESDAYAAAVNREDGLFDFVLIDGDWRERCIEPSLRALRADRFVYIDNIDAAGRDAAQLLHSTLPGVEVRHYTDLVPGAASATTGMSAYIH